MRKTKPRPWFDDSIVYVRKLKSPLLSAHALDRYEFSKENTTKMIIKRADNMSAHDTQHHALRARTLTGQRPSLSPPEE